jgi:hypothetical protein
MKRKAVGRSAQKRECMFAADQYLITADVALGSLQLAFVSKETAA